MRKYLGYFVWKIIFFPILGGVRPHWIRPPGINIYDKVTWISSNVYILNWAMVLTYKINLALYEPTIQQVNITF